MRRHRGQAGGARASSVTTGSTWKSSSKTPATLKSSCWPTGTATPSTSASGTALSSAATRRCWRKCPCPRDEPRTAGSGWARLPSRRRRPAAITTPGPSSFCWIPGGPVLLYGDEHPDPGGAPRHRVGHRRRPGQACRSASRPARSCPLPRRISSLTGPRDRVSDQRRKPRPGFPALARDGSHALHMPGGPGDPDRYARSTQGYEITPYYDSMIAKLIAYAPTREEAHDEDEVGAGGIPGRRAWTPTSIFS